MGSLISRSAEIAKPEAGKESSLSATSADQPVELEPDTQVEIYSSMGRTRDGSVPDSFTVWGDRTFDPRDRAHPCAKPQDRGMNPASTERQRRFMGAELGRLRRGEATETRMSEGQLRDFARKKRHKKHNPY